MIRLLIWIVRMVIIGPRWLSSSPAVCVRGCYDGFFGVTTASKVCEHGLCSGCCEDRCRCLAHRIEQTRELRKELAP